MSLQKLSHQLSTLTPFFAVGGVILSLVSVITLWTMAPYISRQAIADEKTEVLAQKLEDNTRAHETLVSQAQLADTLKAIQAKQDDIIHRLDIISGRVDSINNYLRK